MRIDTCCCDGRRDGELRLDTVSRGEALGRKGTGSVILPRRVPSDISQEHHDITQPSSRMKADHRRVWVSF
jgi:hypothetical protein